MRILLTGGTGFIGSYVLRFLLEAGQQVNVLVRDPSKLFDRNTPNLNVFAGDITQPESVNKSMGDCDTVIHLAALVRSTAKDPSEFDNVNLHGTINLLQAAGRNGVRQFIFSSSLSGHSFLPQPIVTEESLFKPEQYVSRYAKTKAKAEELIREFSQSRFSHIIVYPTRVFGIGPLTDANGATKAINLYLKNGLPFMVERGEQYASWVFVEDVARGIVSAATSNIANQRFILGGENKTLAEVYTLADRISGKRHLRVNLKNGASSSLVSALEFQAQLLRRRPIITRAWLGYVMESRQISCTKAIAELNYRITPLETALEKTIRWLQTL
jgi:farnesol dehydrogenase